MAKYMLVAIDDLTRHNYSYLTPDDECYYLCEYFSGMGYSYSIENQLIFNFKKPKCRQGEPGYHYKTRAIQQISTMFCDSILPSLNADNVTIVPVPPSKTKAHPHYDDRMTQVLRLAFENTNTPFDYRELIIQTVDMDAAHGSNDRPRPENLKSNYRIDPELSNAVKDLVILFDDVLTTGAHYVACRDLIKETFPNKAVIGIFIARCNRSNRARFDFADIDI